MPEGNLIKVFSKVEASFYEALNIRFLNHKELSWKAKGIQSYLRSRRGSWELQVKDLINKSADGELSVRNGLDELMSKKYLYRVTKRDTKKRILKWIFVSFDEPTEISESDLGLLLEKLDVDKQDVDNRHVIYYNNNKDYYYNKINNNSISKETSSLENKIINRSAISADKLSNSNLLNKEEKESIEIIKFWNSLGKPLTVHKLSLNSKTISRAIDSINKLRLNYSNNDIQYSMRTYHKLVLDENTIIDKSIPGHVVRIDEFFNGFSDTTFSRMRKAKVNLKIKSWFDECLPNKDPIRKYINPKNMLEDKYPEVTEKIKKMWIDKVNGGIDVEFSVDDENKFKRASIQIIDFFKIHKKKLVLSNKEYQKPRMLVKYIYGALSNSLNGDLSRITPGWLCSKKMFSRTLPAYLHDQAMVIDDKLI